MTTLKALRDRRKSVLSTQKITLAMKMVAGAKLRRAQEQVEASRPYTQKMRQMLQDLAINSNALEFSHPLLTGTGQEVTQLVIVATSDRGLCGPFNSSIVRYARKLIDSYLAEGKTVKIICIGRKAKDMLHREYSELIIESFTEVGYPHLKFKDAQYIADSLLKMFDDGLFDVCTLVYNQFKSAMTQVVTKHQIIPIEIEDEAPTFEALYEYEPNEESILSKLLPHNLAVQIYNSLLENAASEQGARMTAMDSASRNAGDMIRKLTLTYNRTRQAMITRELIEIISGAEAL